MLRDEKDADETFRKRAKRQNYSDSIIFFGRPEVVKIFTTLCVY